MSKEKQRNSVTKRFRAAWSSLSDEDKHKRFQYAVRSAQNGFFGGIPPSFEDFNRQQRQLDKHQIKSKARTRKKLRAMPPLFDTSGRTTILTMLAANGPMTVREIARARHVDSSTTYRTVDRLLRCGLVVKRSRAGGRKYVSLDRSHVAASELKTLFDLLARVYGVPLIEQPSYRHGLPHDRDPSPPITEDRMFGSRARSRMLIFLSLVGEADETQLARVLAEKLNSVHYAIHALQKKKIVSSRKVGIRHVFALNLSYNGSTEFVGLLKRLGTEQPVYATLRDVLPDITMRWS
jgi:DNA-binding MarR family transcriptional regulator